MSKRSAEERRAARQKRARHRANAERRYEERVAAMRAAAPQVQCACCGAPAPLTIETGGVCQWCIDDLCPNCDAGFIHLDAGEEEDDWIDWPPPGSEPS